MKNGIYNTLDGRSKDGVSKEIKKFEKGNGSQIKSIRGQAIKNQQNPSCNRPQIPSTNNHKLETGNSNQKSSGWHLATFSSPEQLAQIKERQEKIAHENMLRKELKQFREELEQKHRLSETNRKYVFPRPAETVDEKDSPMIDCKSSNNLNN